MKDNTPHLSKLKADKSDDKSIFNDDSMTHFNIKVV